MKKKKLLLKFVFIFILAICFCANVKAEEDFKYNHPFNTESLTIKYDTNNPIKDDYIGNWSCGGITNFTFHKRIPDLTSTVYNLFKIAVPVILVVLGMMDMFKATSAGKEDEIKKAQKKFIQRLIAGLCAFIVFLIVELVAEWLGKRTGNENAMNCVNCFINGSEYCEQVGTNNNNSNNSNNSNNNNSSNNNNKYTCSSGYTLFKNICIKAKKATPSNSIMATPQCSSGYTLTASMVGDCIKVESAKYNGSAVLRESKLKCNNSICSIANFSFSIYKQTDTCPDEYTEIPGEDENSYFCIKKEPSF